MRIRHFVMLLFVCISLTAGVPSASSQDISNDPNKTAIPTGLNSAINLSSAIVAIDDKSPMATSIGDVPHDPGFLIEDQVSFTAGNQSAQINDLYQALVSVKRSFNGSLAKVPLDSLADFTMYVQTEIAMEDLPFPAVAPDSIAVKAVHRTGRGKLILNRLLLRDYLTQEIHGLPNILDAAQAEEVRRAIGLLDIDDKMLRSINEKLPLDIIGRAVYVGAQVRAVGSGATVYTPEAIYSDGRIGQDYAVQAYLSGLYGYGVSARFDLTPGRSDMVRKVVRLDGIIRQAGRSGIPTTISPELRTRVLVHAAQFLDREDEYRAAKTEAILAVAHTARSLRLALVAGERGIGTIGSFTTAGLSASKLLASRHGRYNGVTLLAGAQVLQYDPDSGGATATVRYGFAVFWQDRVSRVLDQGGAQVGEINRWGTQVGVEYNLHNSLQTRDVYGLYVRQRFEHFTELSLSVGKSASGKAYIGFSVGHTFSTK